MITSPDFFPVGRLCFLFNDDVYVFFGSLVDCLSG